MLLIRTRGHRKKSTYKPTELWRKVRDETRHREFESSPLTLGIFFDQGRK